MSIYIYIFTMALTTCKYNTFHITTSELFC